MSIPVTITMTDDGILIKTNYPLQASAIATLSNPERLFIDVCCASSEISNKLLDIQAARFGIDSIRIGKHPDKLRIVIQSSKPSFPAHRVVSTGEGIKVLFNNP